MSTCTISVLWINSMCPVLAKRLSVNELAKTAEEVAFGSPDK